MAQSVSVGIADSPIVQPLTLPCGQRLSNRLAKAAMTEGLAGPRLNPTPQLERLYQRWAQDGAGLLITGNVQIDRWVLERPGNVVERVCAATGPGFAVAVKLNSADCQKDGFSADDNIFSQMGWYYSQLMRLGAGGREPDWQMPLWRGLVAHLIAELRAARRIRGFQRQVPELMAAERDERASGPRR